MTTTFGNVTSTQKASTFIDDKLMMSENVTGVEHSLIYKMAGTVIDSQQTNPKSNITSSVIL